MNTNMPNKSSLEIVQVLLPLPLSTPYDYLIPKNCRLFPGNFVLVPLGNRVICGVVWSFHKYTSPRKKLKEIIKILEVPKMPQELIQLIEWTAFYTISPMGSILKMATPGYKILKYQKLEKKYFTSGKGVKRLTKSRKKILDFMKDSEFYYIAEIKKNTGVSESVIKKLVEENIIIIKNEVLKKNFFINNTSDIKVDLNSEQLSAVNSLNSLLSEDKFSVNVLDGVTGSGKTEVYFEFISKIIELKKQCLVMLPEIVLTSQWLDRFYKRFGSMPIVWHSNISKTEKRDAWHAISEGAASVVVGARSSLFLPFTNLAAIIVDEEHDVSYKQQSGVFYNARDMAIVRSKFHNIPILLISATPSLETTMNIKTNRYKKFTLSKRFGGAVLPETQLIDLRSNKPYKDKWISKLLYEEMKYNLSQGGQVLLFLNRRGYAPLTICSKCGYRLRCPNCSSWLVAHKNQNLLLCHHCDFSSKLLQKCSSCKAYNEFTLVGPGVERISEEISSLFPDYSQAILSSDIINNSKEISLLFRKIEEKKIDIIIGTQVISKGHHFPHLSLVGVVDADIGLSGGDLRAAERTFQLLSQVSGRAGREKRKGKVLLQTYFPDHPVMKAIADGERDKFMDIELSSRKQYSMPPYGRLVGLIISAKSESQAKEAAVMLASCAPMQKDFEIFGPAPAPLSLLRNRYRYRILIKSSKKQNIQKIIIKWLAGVKLSKNIKVELDVDPYSFL